MQINIEKLPKSTIKLTVTIPSSKVDEVFLEVKKAFCEQIEVPGFRKGNAPNELAEAKIDEGKLNGEVINQILPKSYSAAISEHHIQAISSPKIFLKQFEKGKDFIFEAEVATLPEVKINDLRLKIKEKVGQVSKVVYGPDGKPTDGKEGKEEEEVKIEKLFEALLESSEVEVSPILVDQEVDRMMARLVDQLNGLGLTVERYLASQGRTKDALRKEYFDKSEKDLKLEFILGKLISDEKIDVSDQEISDFIKAAPDEKARRELEKEEKKRYIKAVLAKQKLIRNLLEEA